MSVEDPQTNTYDSTDWLKTASRTTNLPDKNGNTLSLGTGASLENTFYYDQENRLYRTGPCRSDVNASGTLDSADGIALAARVNKAEGSNEYDFIFDLDANFVINSGDQLYRSIEVNQVPAKNCRNIGPNTGNERNWYSGAGLRMRARTFFASPAWVDDDYVWDQGAGLPVVLQDVRTAQGSPPTTTTTTYLYGLGLIAQTDGAGVTSFYMGDGLGSTTDLRDASGNQLNTYTYDVWGAQRSSSGATANQFDFAGQQSDHNANRGLIYLRARHYDPALGRFLSRDPVDSGNRYAYAGNNPVNAVDPSGLLFESIDWNLVADVAGFLPVVGTFIDVGHGIYYLSQGNWGTALLYAGAAIPAYGDAFAGERFALKYGDDVALRLGRHQGGVTRTLETALSPQGHIDEVVRAYGFKLRGSGRSVQVVYNPGLASAGMVRRSSPSVIEVGPLAMSSSDELGRTIAHELNHARSFLAGGSASESAAYAAEDAFSDWLIGGR